MDPVNAKLGDFFRQGQAGTRKVVSRPSVLRYSNIGVYNRKNQNTRLQGNDLLCYGTLLLLFKKNNGDLPPRHAVESKKQVAACNDINPLKILPYIL